MPQGLFGSAASGAVTGGAMGALGGPLTAPVGAAVGAGLGAAGYVVGSYVADEFEFITQNDWRTDSSNFDENIEAI